MDDQLENRELLVEMLTRIGIVKEGKNGENAIAQIRHLEKETQSSVKIVVVSASLLDTVTATTFCGGQCPPYDKFYLAV